MKKAIIAFSLTLTLALMLGVGAQAEALLPKSAGYSKPQGDYILPGSDEISGEESQDPGAADTETGTAAETTPAVNPTATAPAAGSAAPVIAPVIAPAADSGELHIAFNGTVSGTVVPLMIGDTTYVPFRAFCMAALDGAVISWNAETNTSFCTAKGLVIEASFDRSYIVANGRVLYRDDANISLNDTLYIPVRSLAAAIGAQVEWNEAALCVNLSLTGTPITPADQYYNQTDLLWLARIINAESRYEPLIGKIAVGNVILNRVADPDFPDTVYDVIFDCRYAVQFYPVTSPVIYNTPSDESIVAAKACLEGYSVSGNILYFMNPKLAVSTWISRNRSFLFAIGNHSFYA